jgi:antitoxin MazE
MTQIRELAPVVAIRANLVRIGNSRGIRIPKSLIGECHLEDAVELSVVDGSLVVRPAPQSSPGLGCRFGADGGKGDDSLLDPDTSDEFDATEWEWPEG